MATPSYTLTFTTDEMLLLRHLLTQAGEVNLLQDETLYILDVDSEDDAVAIRDTALAKVRKALGTGPQTDAAVVDPSR